MKRLITLLAATLAMTGCVSTKDLAKNLRYADQRAVPMEQLRFVELGRLQQGRACTLNFLQWLPLYGDGSIITAVNEGKINQLRFIGETGRWYFPFSTNCTVVFGDSPDTGVAASVPVVVPPAASAPPVQQVPASQPPQSEPVPRRGFW